MRWLLASPAGFGATIVRIVLGAVMLPHAAQKVFGAFGGPGLSATMASFTDKMGIAPPLAVLAILAEALGSLGLIVGLLTRIAALGILAVMVGAIALVHWQNGFFMNWHGQQPGEGFEYHLLAIGMALSLVVMGGGRWSLDRWILRRRERAYQDASAALPASRATP